MKFFFLYWSGVDFLNFYLFILGCAGSSLLYGLFSSYSKQELLFLAMCRFLIAVASLVAEHRMQSIQASGVVTRGLNNCNSPPLEHRLNSCRAQA